jgi:hypothetical protein
LSKGVFEDTDELCKSKAEIDRAIACFIFSGLSFLFGQQLEMQLPDEFAAFGESADCAIQAIMKTLARVGLNCVTANQTFILSSLMS